jgi:TetR/AcrR family transcriptional regulator
MVVVARPGRPKDSRNTAERCLIAAESRFANQGFSGTGLRDVASDIGVTSATIIHHFGTKERLYARVLDRLAVSLDGYVEQAGEDTAEAVVAMFERFLDWSFDHQQYAQLLLRELMENQARVSKARRLHLLSVIDYFVQRIESAQRTGRFRPFDAEIFVFYTLGAITHFSAAAPTVDRMLRGESGGAIARFRLSLRENVSVMLVGATLERAPKTRRRRSAASAD